MASDVRVFRTGLDARLIIPVWLVLSLLLTVAGPFGTYITVAFHQRAVFWTLLVGLALASGLVLYRTSQQLIFARSAYFSGLVTAAGTSFVFAPLFVWLVRRFAHDPSVRVPSMVEVALFIFSATAGAVALREIWRGTSTGLAGVGVNVDLTAAAVGPPTETEQTPLRSPRLLDRLPDDLRGDLLRISVRDHYVDVTTTQGNHALLMRFSDAISETEGADGLQVHRSHWVARGAIRRVTPGRGKAVLHLSDGSDVPVSKPYVPALQAQGLLPIDGNGSTRMDFPAVMASPPEGNSAENARSSQ